MNEVKNKLEVFCDHYCRFPREYDEDIHGVPLAESGICLNCPLNDLEKAGHWIDVERGRWVYAECSECHTIHDTRTDFCPNCGAKMEGENE